MKKLYAFFAFVVLFNAGLVAVFVHRTAPPATATAGGDCSMEGCSMGDVQPAAKSDPSAKSKPTVGPVTGAKALAIACPVTHEKIASREKAAGMSVYNGKTYYFCCLSCKPKFDKDPTGYLHGKGQRQPSGHLS